MKRYTYRDDFRSKYSEKFMLNLAKGRPTVLARNERVVAIVEQGPMVPVTIIEQEHVVHSRFQRRGGRR